MPWARAITSDARGIAAALLALLTALLLLHLPPHLPHPTHQAWLPVEVTDQPAGIAYRGPPTTAVAGWFCISSLDATPLPGPWGLREPVGYSVQLNAGLSSGEWVQVVIEPNQPPWWSIAVYLWSSGRAVHVDWLDTTQPPQCGWLFIAVLPNGTAWAGLTGGGQAWSARFAVGGAVIVPGPTTGVVIAGPGPGEGLNMTRALVYLAMYFWNGTAWAPAPVGVDSGGTGEWVSRAWVYTSGVGCGVVSWPEPVNTTVCPPPPSFSPYP